MNAIDIIILICFLPFIYEGLTKGLVAEIVSIVSVLLGAWLAFHFSEIACGWLGDYLPSVSPALMNLIGFLIIFAAGVFILNLLGKIVEKVIKIALLGWLNRLLGLALSLVKGMLIISLFVVLFSNLNGIFQLVPQETLDASVAYQPLKDLGYEIFPYLKALLFKE